MLDDLIALFLENAHPVRDRRLPPVNLVLAPFDAGGREEIVELTVGQQA